MVKVTWVITESQTIQRKYYRCQLQMDLVCEMDNAMDFETVNISRLRFNCDEMK